MDPKQHQQLQQQQQQQCYASGTNGEILVSSSTSTANTQKSKAQLNSGNYINVVPMAVVNSGVQFHPRNRKYPPPQLSNAADYQ